MRSLQSEVEQYRTVYKDFSRQSDRDGGTILNKIINFENEVNCRYGVINHIQQKLTSLVEHFEPYVNNVNEVSRKDEKTKISPKKRRFRVDVPLDAGLLAQVNGLGKSHCVGNK